MALMHNSNDDVVAVVFINGLKITHSFYKHLVKYEIIEMRDIFTHTQKYIQIEDATRNSANCSPK